MFGTSVRNLGVPDIAVTIVTTTADIGESDPDKSARTLNLVFSSLFFFQFHLLSCEQALYHSHSIRPRT